MAFVDDVQAAFDGLMGAHGFRFEGALPSGAGEAAAYRKPPLTLTLSWWKGEVRADLALDLDFVQDHPVFRPYRSRTFGLDEILRLVDPMTFRTPSSSGMPVFIQTEAQCAFELARLAGRLARIATPVLEGHYRVLETLTQRRYPDAR